MKKFIFLGLAAIFCLAMAVPATADMKMGGAVSVDFGYITFSPEAFGPGDTEVSQVHFSNNKVFSRWNGRYESEDGKLVGMMELYGGASSQRYNAAAGLTNYSNDISWSYAYIVWRPAKNQSFQIGFQTSLFADEAPGPYPLLVGEMRGRTPTGYGDFNHGGRVVGFRWMTRFSDMFRFELALIDPGNSEGYGDFSDGPEEHRTYNAVNDPNSLYDRDGDGAPDTFPYGYLPPDAQGDLRWYWVPGPASPTSSVPSEVSKWPRLDAKLPMYFGGMRVCVSGTYGKQEYENIGSGVVDEGFDVWGFAASIKWPIGIFTLSAEAFLGQNLGGGTWAGGMGPTAKWSQALWNADTQKFNDCDNYGGWIGASVKLGPGPLGAYFSMAKDEWSTTYNGTWDPTLNGTLSQTSNRLSYGVYYILPLGKGFTMRPVFNYYDDSELEYRGTAMNNVIPGIDANDEQGNYWNAGVEFTLAF